MSSLFSAFGKNFNCESCHVGEKAAEVSFWHKQLMVLLEKSSHFVKKKSEKRVNKQRLKVVINSSFEMSS